MDRIKGDPNVHVTQAMVTEAFRRAGAIEGDVVMYHGSLSSMGTVDGGVTAVTDGVLAAVGPTGTVAMPSLYYNGKPETRNPAQFDIATSPTWVGALAEGFRTDPRSVRSNHWTHSVSAIGARAQELCANHGEGGTRPSPWSETAFAPNSPWQKFIDWNALYCFIGVDLQVCTLRHLLEGAVVERILSGVPVEKRQEMRLKLRHDCDPDAPPVWSAFKVHEMQCAMVAEGIYRTTALGCATLGYMRAGAFARRALEILEAAPAAWFVLPDFLAWRDECMELARYHTTGGLVRTI